MISTRSRLRFKMIYRGDALTRVAAELAPLSRGDSRWRRCKGSETFASVVACNWPRPSYYLLAPASGSMDVRALGGRRDGRPGIRNLEASD